MHRLSQRTALYLLTAFAVAMLVGAFSPAFAVGAVVTALAIALSQEGRRQR